MLPRSTESPLTWPITKTDLSSHGMSDADGLVLSIVVPVFNEEETIVLFLQAMDAQTNAIRAALGPGGQVEILFVLVLFAEEPSAAGHRAGCRDQDDRQCGNTCPN